MPGLSLRTCFPARLIRISGLIILFTLTLSGANAQELSKLSPTLKNNLAKFSPGEVHEFVIALSGKNVFSESIVDLREVDIVYKHEPSSVYVIRTTRQILEDRILPLPGVLFVDTGRTPFEEVAVSNLDISLNKATMLHRYYPSVNGGGLTVSVKENRPDTQDIDFKGRYLPSGLESPQLSSHATIMATIIAGAGNTFYEGAGVARGASLSSVNFTNLLPEPEAYYQQFGVSVQNHSYGTGIENYYGGDAVAYDASVIMRPNLLHVFSAGNAGLSASTSGAYAGIPAFATITGSFKMAKNIITVSHTDSTGLVLMPGSKGPGYDGRVYPQLVAFGEDGSSGAAAIVSGVSLVLQHAYRDIYGSLPPGSLIRALLYNSADDAGPPGIDFYSGYGSVNAQKAIETLYYLPHFTGSVSNGGQQMHNIVVPASAKKVRVTLVWNDPPAGANAARALVNDLDLELVETSSGNTWLPWVLSHYPHPDSLNKLPVRKKDHLNNTEQISVDLPAPGNYNIVVRGFDIPSAASQSYSLVYAIDTLNRFGWVYSTILGGRTNMIRWNTTYDIPGTIEFSYDGTNWQLITSNANLREGYHRWPTPDSFARVMLRMQVGSEAYVSEPFTISKRFNLEVGFDCADSFSFYWNRIPGVDSFRVFRLGEKYMESITTTTDTFFVLNKQSSPSLHYAVAPVIEGLEGIRTYAYNYTTQGVGCYIRSFLASLSGNNGLLELLLGTSYNIRSITWQKLTTSGYISLSTITPVNTTSYQYTDLFLLKGSNVYRVRIELMNGQVIYSNPETIYYFGDHDYIVYPNPVMQEGTFHILNKEAVLTQVQVINSSGMKVLETKFSDLELQVSAARLSKGFYIIRLLGENRVAEFHKLVVQ